MHIVLYASKIMTAEEVMEQSKLLKKHKEAGNIVAANIVMLRNASKKSRALKGVVN